MEPKSADTYELNLLEMMKLKHVVLGQTLDSLYMKFSISQSSGSMGIASRWAKPSLSVIYPSTDKPPIILSRDDRYTSALFVTISGQDYLVAASTDSIHLWNLANNTSSVVYKFKEQKNWHLDVIDERTVACVAMYPSLIGLNKVYILKTNSSSVSAVCYK